MNAAKSIGGAFLAVCAAMLLALACLPATAFAQGEPDTWDGTADTGWYNADSSEFEIDTAEQLAGLAVLVNGTKDADYKDYQTFAGKTVYLNADLDISGYEWVSIGSGANVNARAFCGTFDGQGHEISGLYSHEDYISGNADSKEHNAIRTGLFGAVYQGTIQNLGVVDADIFISENDTSTYGMGIIADWFTSSNMYNCYSSGSITGGSYVEKYIGGLIGFVNGNITVRECYSQAAITGNYTNSGNLYSNSMDYWDSLGGLIGASYTGTAIIDDCWFDGEIIVNSIQAPVGGIIGYSEEAMITNCMVATTSLGNDGEGNTCWIGYEVSTPATNCIYPDDETYGTTPINDSDAVPAGIATSNFNDDAILGSLNEHAADGISWTAGINHPTFTWDYRNIAADYSAVNEAIAKAEALDKSLYQDFSAVEAAIAAVEQNLSVLQQETVEGYAAAIENAIAALEYKPADYSKVDAAIAQAQALNKDDYKDFTAVENAIAAVERGKNITEQETVDAYAAAIEQALAALEKKPLPNPDNNGANGNGNAHNNNASAGSQHKHTATLAQTGDSTAFAPLIGLAALSAVVLAGALRFKAKHK